MNEFEWISFLKDRIPDTGCIGIGDDAAVLPDGKLISTDTFVENIHFRSDWADWRKIGRKACEASISDIAAMGGKPLWLLINLSSATSEPAVEILEGILECRVPLIGGDTTGSHFGALTLTLTVIGEAKRIVFRSGAEAGDRIFISNALGGSLLGQLSFEKNLGIKSAEEKFLNPRARIDISELWGEKASSMIDISDGLSTELNHLANSSKKKFVIDTAKIPLFKEKYAGFNPIEIALSSGDEYELLATSKYDLPGGFEIGIVEEGMGVYCNGNLLLQKGYAHWR